MHKKFINMRAYFSFFCSFVFVFYFVYFFCLFFSPTLNHFLFHFEKWDRAGVQWAIPSQLVGLLKRGFERLCCRSAGLRLNSVTCLASVTERLEQGGTYPKSKPAVTKGRSIHGQSTGGLSITRCGDFWQANIPGLYEQGTHGIRFTPNVRIYDPFKG